MKKTAILFAIILLGIGAVAGAVTSASFGWSIPPVDVGDRYDWDITLELSDEPLVWTDPDSSPGYDLGNITAELPNGTMIYVDPNDILIPVPPTNGISIDEMVGIPLDNVPRGKYCNITDSITIYNITDSYKIYYPHGRIWWVPVQPYNIKE